MKASEIKIGHWYFIMLSGVPCRVRIDAINDGSKRGKEYLCFNENTQRTVTVVGARWFFLMQPK